jgi:long-chain fatty acid transport protein
MYFNPAALGMLDATQVVVSGHAIDVSAEFTDQGSTLPAAGAGRLPRGATRQDAGSTIGVPNAYFALPLNERLAFGLGVNVPFGLKTTYDDPWVGRFQGIRSELETLNVNPALSWKLNDLVTIGGGINYQHADVKLSNAVMLGLATEGRAVLDVDDNAWGWNAGVLFNLPSTTRVGLSYRSRLDFKLSGDTTVTGPTGATIAAASGPTTAEITFPDSAYLSVAQPLSTALELRADVSWMNWGEIGTVLATNSSTGALRDTLNFQLEDAWRVAVGAVYNRNERWTFRSGIAWDQSPVRDQFRTVRLPDADRYWLSVGARWKPLDPLSVDLGYAHLFVKDADVALTRQQLGGPASFASTVVGSYENAVDILSLQLTWAFR